MTLNLLIKNMTNLTNFLTFSFVILAIAYQKVESLQCYVPGECYLSPTIDVIYHEDYNSCLMESESLNASWFSFDPVVNVCELFSSCTNLTTYYCNQCISGERGCEQIMCDTIGQCQVYLALLVQINFCFSELKIC